jgi:hypothetical protein
LAQASPFEVYCMYLALKMHFSSERYDYVKYHGKVNASKDSFSTRKDRFQFQRLARKYHAEDMQDFLVANFVAGVDWVGQLLEDEAKDNYTAFIKRRESFSYVFKQELQTVFASVKTPADAFKSAAGEYPPLLYAHMSGEIGTDGLAVLNVFVKFFPRFDERIGATDPIWSKIRHKASKLLPFVQYDPVKIKQILKESI